MDGFIPRIKPNETSKNIDFMPAICENGLLYKNKISR